MQEQKFKSKHAAIIYLFYYYFFYFIVDSKDVVVQETNFEMSHCLITFNVPDYSGYLLQNSKTVKQHCSL